MKLKPFINTVYLKDFGKRRRLEKISENIIVDTFWDETGADFCIHEATVYGVPSLMSSGEEVEIVPGDRVLCHHFLTDESCVKDIDGERMSELHYNHVFAKYNDKVIEPIQDYVFVKPIDQDKSGFNDAGIFILKSGTKLRQGELAFVSKSYPKENIEQGAVIGSKVVFMPNREYEIKIDGVLYYKMKHQDLEMVFNNNDIEVK